MHRACVCGGFRNLVCTALSFHLQPHQLPDSIPSHVSPCCPTCSSAAAAAALSRSRTPPSFFQPCAFHSSVIWSPAQAALDLSASPELFQPCFHQYILQLSSFPPGSGLTLLCRDVVSHCFFGISIEIELKPPCLCWW